MEDVPICSLLTVVTDVFEGIRLSDVLLAGDPFKPYPATGNTASVDRDTDLAGLRVVAISSGWTRPDCGVSVDMRLTSVGCDGIRAAVLEGSGTTEALASRTGSADV